MYTFYCRYYEKDEDVKGDYEFQSYLNELSVDGSSLHNGGIGRVSKESLNHLLHLLLYSICSITIALLDEI